ncbi:DNA-binding transcriptional response regulator [Geomonas oryzae]|uniref:response regulator n=1 Tax=Geomonas oryzae TaxID=2364273 RepID=UPI00100B77CB|nr:response regulator [Geomonas oryzae]
MKELRVVVAEHDAVRRDRMADSFRTLGYSVTTMDTAAELLQGVFEIQGGVLLLDGEFDPHIASADLLHLLKRGNPNLQVILVCDDVPATLARRVHNEGIFYCALKPADPTDTEELEAAVGCAFRKNIENGRKGVVGEKNTRMAAPARHVACLMTLLAVVIGAALTLAIQGAGFATAGLTYLFLGFCAVIITTQLLPIFRIRLAHRVAQTAVSDLSKR